MTVPEPETVAVDGRALGGRAARGAVVTLGAQGIRIVVQVLSVVVLSRLLSPRDYGLIAMVLAVIGVADVFRDLGLSTAAIQARTLTAAQRTNLFWVNSALGLVLGGVVFALAPALAHVYGQPELVDIARVLALSFLLNGVATQYRADLTRRLLFARLAVADVVSPVIGLGVGVVMALSGAGYWALVGQQLAQYAVMMTVVVTAGRWLPGRPDRTAPMGGLLRFGWNMVGVQLIGYTANNIDSITIGARFGAGALGVYSRAFQLLMTPLGQLRGPATQVALPVLSSLQDDGHRFAEYLRRGQLALGYTLVAGLGLVVGAAEPVTAVFLGEQWGSVPPLLRFLALAGIFETLALVGYWVYLSRGLTGQLVRYASFEAAVRLACILVGSSWGVEGVAAGYALSPALTWPISLWWLSRFAPMPVRQLLGGALRVLVVCAGVAGSSFAGAHALADAPAALALAGAGAAALLAYAVLCSAVAPLRRDLQSVVLVVRLAVRRRTAQPGA
jgi:PST family polysaccharide transporter